MKQIAAAIIAVMKEVKGMEKNSEVGNGKNSYNGTKDSDVKEVFNTALETNGLCMMPIDIEESTDTTKWDSVDYNGNPTVKQSVFTKVTVKYMLLHISGENITIAGYGHGVDPQDKGAGKATTYAMKNALLYTFMTPVGKIDDTETTHSDDIPTPKTKPAFKKLTQSEVDKWNGKIYGGKNVYIDNVQYEIGLDQIEKLKALPNYIAK